MSDCFREVFRQGMCCGHFKRRQRGQKVDGPIDDMSYEERVIETGSAMLEADGDGTDDGSSLEQ